MVSTNKNTDSFQARYPNVADCIEGEWQSHAVNIEYLTKCVVEHIESELNDGLTLDYLGDISESEDNSAVSSIISALEPDCINGSSHRGSWIHASKEQLKTLNSRLVVVYKADTESDVAESSSDIPKTSSSNGVNDLPPRVMNYQGFRALASLGEWEKRVGLKWI